MADRVSDFLAQWARERPDLDAAPMGVIGRLSRVDEIVGRTLQATFQGFGLHRGEFDTLATLRRSGSPFTLTNLLLPRLLAGGASVVSTSSMANRLFGHLDLSDLDNERRYSPRKAYGDAKLANVLFTRSLHMKFHDQGLSAVAFHPGLVRTGFSAGSASSMRWFYHSPLARFTPMISPEQGGAILAWFLTGTPGSTWTSGRYYDQDRPTTRVNSQADDLALADGLWQRSAELVGLPPAR